MKAFLVLLVFIWATHASEPAQFGADSNHGQGLDHVRLDDGVIGDNVVGSVEGSAHLQKVERQTRDVAHVLGTYKTLETPTEDAGNKEDNTVNQSALVAEHKTPQHVGPQEFLKRSARDVVHVLATYTTLAPLSGDLDSKECPSENLETGQPQTAVVDQNKTPQHVELIKENVAPQAYLERPTRDVSHVLRPGIGDVDRKEDNFENLATSQTQSAVVALHKTPQHVVEVIKQNIASPEYLKRPTRDVAHVLRPGLGDVNRKEDNSENLATSQPQSAVVDRHKTPQHIVELIKQNVNPQEYLERPVRDVAHVLRPGLGDVNRKEDNSENLATSQPLSAVVAQHKTPQHVVELTKQSFATQEYLERPTRDVVQLLRPAFGDIDRKENLATSQPQSAVVAQHKTPQHVVELIKQNFATQEYLERPPRDAVHLLRPSFEDVNRKEDNSECVTTIQPQSALVAQQQQPIQHVAEFIKQHVVPQESLERPVRDVIHLLKPHTTELSREDKTENSAQYPLQGPDVAPRVTDKSPQPLTGQEQAAPETFTTLAPQAEEDLRKDFTANTTETVELQSVPIFQPTPQHVAREIIKQVALQNHLQRHVREVKHLFKPRTRLPSLFKKGNGNSENTDTVSLQSDNVAELQLERQVRDVAHLYGTHTTLTSRNDLQLGIEDNAENAEKFQFEIPEVVQSIPYIPQASNPQQAVEQNQVERHRRYVRHLDGSSSYTTLKPHTKDQAIKEENNAEDAEQQIGSQERLKRAVEVQYNKSPSTDDNIKHSSEDSIGDPSTIFDQIVEDDHYVERHVAKDLDPQYVPAIKEPSFDKKAKRWVFTPTENIGQIPEYIQKVAQVEAEDHNDVITSSTIPDAFTQTHEPDLSEANKRVARSPAVPVNDPSEIQNCDHIKSQDSQHGLKTAEPNEANKRVVRSSDPIPSSDCVEVSTANPQHVNVVTTTPDKVDVRELLKPTVKVQIHRLPLTAFAQRNTMTKTTRRYPDVSVTVPPKGAKRKY